MLQRMPDLPALSANPVDAFASWVGFWLIQLLFTENSVHVLAAQIFILVFIHILPRLPPAHLFCDLFVGCLGVSVLVQQLPVFLRPCVTFFKEPFVVMLVPFLLR